ATAVERAAHRDADPALADAIFLDVRALVTVEDDADAAAQGGLVVVRAARVVAEAVGRGLAHADSIGPGRRSVPARGARGYRAGAAAAGSAQWLAFGSAAAQQVGQRFAVVDETEGDGVQAVAIAGGRRPVGEDVPEMASAAGTDFLHPHHAVAEV